MVSWDTLCLMQSAKDLNEILCGAAVGIQQKLEYEGVINYLLASICKLSASVVIKTASVFLSSFAKR